ncbi:DNA polymerase III subunit gamma and tau [Cellulomonas sp.]|uniref:DNA polymerase III subunit gamma and tau n=1 Tax=Cellulomonas sp. TaxID=40001 RepID=UPI001B0A90FD|nr:DNA polymerase III subunit gamma and tau [Cellulomonas sp.]MBO9555316.1 DNA polymerase III subunit gamma and tau [Cellulomonas sp.]
MTTALYRRYRPENFAEVIGQDHVTAPLRQALRSGQVNHAYLFSGPRGCGKTTSARILARILNCAQNTEASPTDTPCGVCPSCVELARGGSGSLDVVEIDAASHGGVDDARELRERATFAPARDRFKVFILDEAHMVTPQGFNALLKIVEEPPPHVKFIFATTEPDKVIGTIRSRTHHYPFRLVPPDVLVPYLDQLCAAESVPVGSGVLPLVVRAGAGSVRDTLSVLDQLIAGSGGAGLEYEGAAALLGYTPAALLDDLVDAIAARDGAAAFRIVERVISTGHEPRRFVEDLLERLRDLIVIAASGDAADAALRDVPADQMDRMRLQAQNLGPSELSRSADLANAALTEMTGATSPRLHLELLMARLLLPAADDARSGLGARLDRLERGLPAGAVAPRGADDVPATPDALAAPVATGRPVQGGARAAREAIPTSAPSVPSAPAPLPVGPIAAVRPADPVAAPAAAPTEPTAGVPVEPTGHVAGAPTGHVAGEPTTAAPVAAEDVEDVPEVESAVAPDAATEPDVADAGTEPVVPDAEPEPVVPDAEPEPAVTPRQAESVATAQQAEPVAAPAPAPAPAAVPAPSAPPAGSGGGQDTEMLRRRWPEVLETVKGLRRVTWALVDPRNAQVAELDASTLKVAFSTSQLATTFRNGGHDAVVARAVRETLGFDVRVEGVVGDQAARPTAPAVPAATGGAGAGGGPARGTGSSAQAVSPAQAAASWDEEPPLPEPPDDEPPHPDVEAPRASAAPAWGDEPRPDVPGAPTSSDKGPLSARERGEAAAARSSAARSSAAQVVDEPSPDDPDITGSSLVGAPLVAQMLGGTVIDEQVDDHA